MKKYYYINRETVGEDSGSVSIISGPDYLPVNYKNVSGFNNIADNSLLNDLNWVGEQNKGFWEAVYPDSIPEISSSQKIVESSSINLVNSTIDVSFSIEDLSLEEKNMMTASYKDQLRPRRDQLLMATDFTQLPDSPLSDELKSSFVTYRSELRNMFDVATIEEIVWPEMPSGSSIDISRFK
jgi:hypothetical protein